MGRCTLFFLCFATVAALGSADATFSSDRQRALISNPSNAKRTLDLPTTTKVRIGRDQKNHQVAVASASSTGTDVPRGGNTDTPTSRQLTGVITFILIEVGVRKIFTAKGIRFPGQLGGCVALFFVMILAQMVSPGLGDAICSSLSPGAGILAKWMGVFFVPGLVMLPLAPSLGSPFEVRRTSVGNELSVRSLSMNQSNQSMILQYAFRLPKH